MMSLPLAFKVNTDQTEQARPSPSVSVTVIKAHRRLNQICDMLIALKWLS